MRTCEEKAHSVFGFYKFISRKSVYFPFPLVCSCQEVRTCVSGWEPSHRSVCRSPGLVRSFSGRARRRFLPARSPPHPAVPAGLARAGTCRERRPAGSGLGDEDELSPEWEAAGAGRSLLLSPLLLRLRPAASRCPPASQQALGPAPGGLSSEPLSLTPERGAPFSHPACECQPASHFRPQWGRPGGHV